MKIHTKLTVLASLSAVLFLTGCSDWTTPEKIDFYRKTPEEANPKQFAAYLAGIRAYKQTEHNIMIVGMEGTSSLPSSQCQHIMAMPDSADYIVLRMGETLHEKIMNEIAEVREKKGTETILFVDYDEVLSSWLTLEDERNSNGQEPGTDREAEVYFRTETEKLLDRCNEYGFGGVMIAFYGTTDAGFPISAQNGFMGAVKDFHNKNQDKVMMFRGTGRNVSDQEFLTEFKYAVIVTEEDTGLAMLPNRILGRESSLLDRVIFELTVPSSEAPEQVGMAPMRAAEWLVNTDHRGYVPKGLCVENGHEDYFNKEMAFLNIRSAISVMNPIKNEK